MGSKVMTRGEAFTAIQLAYGKLPHPDEPDYHIPWPGEGVDQDMLPIFKAEETRRIANDKYIAKCYEMAKMLGRSEHEVDEWVEKQRQEHEDQR